MAAVTWDILISTLPHRHGKLVELLAEFDRQWEPGLGVLVLRDNYGLVHLESHAKRQALAEASQAEYVSYFDDDDWPAPDFVYAIMGALARNVDYVGFRVDVTWDGDPHRKAIHSLRYASWTGWGDDGPLLRNVSHLNPMRRKAALSGNWNDCTDEQWSETVWQSGLLDTEAFIDREMYHYRFSRHDNFSTQRAPMPEPLPEIPSYPWLTVLP